MQPASGHSPPIAQPTDIAGESELVGRCRAGDASAWRALYDSNFDFVYRISRRLGVPDSELDDVVQETFLVAFRRLGSFESGRFSTWLFRITSNLASGRHRRRRVRETFQALFGPREEPVARGPDRELEASEARAHVSVVLSRMAPKKREVFALFELEGLSGDEVAERVGCKVDTVWTRLHYARKDFERIARKQGLLTVTERAP
ncbi:MAG: RNA polymerase sigma factor [Myxococcaceae bacterium]